MNISVPVRKSVPLHRAPLLAMLIWGSGFLFLTTLFCFIAIVVCVLSGVTFLVERTGSMNPVISSGDLLLTQPVNSSTKLQRGMIASYQYGPYLITHRIIDANLADGYAFKGDANVDADPFVVPRSHIQQVYIGSIPSVGGWLYQLSHTWGRIFLTLGMFLSMSIFYWGIRGLRRNRPQKNAPNDNITPMPVALDLENAA